MIETLQANALRIGPAWANFVRTTDEKTGDVVEDYETGCDLMECDRYACTHLKRAEAEDELLEHARGHAKAKGMVLVNTTAGEVRKYDVIVHTDEVVEGVQHIGPLVIVDFVGGTATPPIPSNTPVEVMRERE